MRTSNADWAELCSAQHASHHRQEKAERGTGGAFCCPSACDVGRHI